MPDAVIEGFAAALGVERVGGDGMDVDLEVDEKGEFKAKGFDGVRAKVREIIREGYSASQIISQVSGITLWLFGRELTTCSHSYMTT